MTKLSKYKKEIVIDGHKITNNKWFLLSFFSITAILIGYAVILAVQTIMTTTDILVKIECSILILSVSILILYIINKWRCLKNDNNKNN